MILVRSRRLLLSGSSVLCCLFLILILDSCSKKDAPSSYDDRAVISRDTVSRADDDVPSIDEIADLIDTNKLNLKDSYDISLLLPLYLDSVYTYDSDGGPEEREEVYRRSKMGLEFYKGVTLALDELKQKGFSATVTLTDTRNSQAVVKNSIESGKLKDQDLIIGPVYNDNLRLMANYCKRQQQYMVSPLSPADDITSMNPYYIMVNPTLDVHMHKIFKYAINNYKDHQFFLYHQPVEFESRYAQMFKDSFTNYMLAIEDTSVVTTILGMPLNEGEGMPSQAEELEELRPYFNKDSANLIIVPSVDKDFILNVSRRLNALVMEEYDITVIGLPVWGDYKGLRFDYLEQLNVHHTSSYWLSPEFYAIGDTNGFNAKYIGAYKHEPSEFAIKGYDVMMYFGTLLNKFGLDYDEYMTESKWQGVHTNFNFAPHYAKKSPVNEEPTADFIENHYVHLLRYQDYTVIKLK